MKNEKVKTEKGKMNNVKRSLFLSLLCILVFGMTITVNAAAKKPKLIRSNITITIYEPHLAAKSLITMKNAPKNSKLVNLKSTNTSVASVVLYNKTHLAVTCKKPGTATISCQIKQNGKVKSKIYRCKVTVVTEKYTGKRYTSPFKSFKYGNKQYAKNFAPCIERGGFNQIVAYKQKKAVSISMNNGYKLKGVSVWTDKSGWTTRKTKNNKASFSIKTQSPYSIISVSYTYKKNGKTKDGQYQVYLLCSK